MQLDAVSKRSVTVAFFGILFLFFIQSASVLVQSVYILDLMNLELDAKAAGLAFLLSPLLLLIPGRKGGVWAGGSLALLLAARLAFPYLGTEGRLLGSGLAVGSALVLLVLGWRLFLRPGSEADASLPSQSLALAVLASTALRALGRGLDPSLEAGNAWLDGRLCLAARLVPALALAAAFTALTMDRRRLEADDEAPRPRGLGLMSLIALVMLAFASPGVIARWVEVDDLVPVGAVSLLSLAWMGLLCVRPSLPRRIGRLPLALWNAAFALALAGLAAASTPRYPAAPYSPALDVGSPGALRHALLALALLLFPVVYVDFARLSQAGAGANPTLAQSPGPAAGRSELGRSALGFAAGSIWLCLLVFMSVFSNVWAYIPPVSPLFRGLFWLPLALAALLPALLVLAEKGPAVPATRAAEARAPAAQATAPAAAASPLGTALGWTALGLIAIIALAASAGRPKATPAPSGRDFLRVMSYNIQAGADGEARRAYAEQLELVRSLDPDVVVLQESDTARISLGNDDLVRFYAESLGYHSFYGPSVAAGTFGTAILSRFPLEEAEVFYTYSDEDEVGTSFARITALGKRWAIFCVHPSGSDDVDLAFARALVERARTEERAIAAGDFNMRRGEKGYEAVEASMSNAWSLLHPEADPLDPKRRWIDHIFVSPGLRVVDAGYVMPPESHSDHPVHWADILP